MPAAMPSAAAAPSDGSEALLVNDLRASLEVEVGEGWQILYPGRSLKIQEGVAEVVVRLVEDRAVLGKGLAKGELKASQSFGDFSEAALRRDLQEQADVQREAKRRREVARQRQALNEKETRRRMYKTEMNFGIVVLLVLPGIATALVILCAAVPPSDDVMAALLSVLAALCCCCVNFWAMVFGDVDEKTGFRSGGHGMRERYCLHVLWGVAVLALLGLTVHHGLRAWWWTSLILWPVAGFAGLCFICSRCARGKQLTDAEEVEEGMARGMAERDVRERTIVFGGSVIEEPGRPCVCSWPGKYEAAWDALVASSRKGEVSAAVVFLPEHTSQYGQHDEIPPSEDLDGACWCVPLYGEQKPWGCRWWSHWIQNIETAVLCGAKLEVYFFACAVGKGKVESFATAGAENLRREALQRRRGEFQQSEEFRQAQNAGLAGLSRDAGGDGSSQYSRELNRLFLAWLPEADRQFLQASEGLGNSQKAEVAWLERKGYSYTEKDVSSWLQVDQGTSRHGVAKVFGF